MAASGTFDPSEQELESTSQLVAATPEDPTPEPQQRCANPSSGGGAPVAHLAHAAEDDDMDAPLEAPGAAEDDAPEAPEPELDAHAMAITADLEEAAADAELEAMAELGAPAEEEEEEE